ncbi:MAG: hypothetical protein NVSMB51_09980 [Solirubrobacteraceae bacterium]
MRPAAGVQQAGAQAVLVSLEWGQVHAMHGVLERGGVFDVEQASAADFDGLILPGGVANPNKLRQSGAALEFVRELFRAGKPVAVIYHGPWTRIEADLVRGR